MTAPTTRGGRAVDPLDGLPSLEVVAAPPSEGLITLYEIRGCLATIARTLLRLEVAVRLRTPEQAAAAVEVQRGVGSEPVPTGALRGQGRQPGPPRPPRPYGRHTEIGAGAVAYARAAAGPFTVPDVARALGISGSVADRAAAQAVRAALGRLERAALVRREKIPAASRALSPGKPAAWQFVWIGGAS